MNDIRHIGTQPIDNGSMEAIQRPPFHQTLKACSSSFPSKADVFKAISENLNIPYKIVESRYYDKMGNIHASGVEILRDLKAMEKLNSPVASGPYEGNKPALPTSELIDSIWGTKEFSNEIADVVSSSYKPEVDKETLFMLLKRVLYFINNRESAKAVSDIIRAMEMVDTNR